MKKTIVLLVTVFFLVAFNNLNAQNTAFEERVKTFLIGEDYGELVNFLRIESNSLYVDSKKENANTFFVGNIVTKTKQVVAFGSWSNLIIKEKDFSVIIRLQHSCGEDNCNVFSPSGMLIATYLFSKEEWNLIYSNGSEIPKGVSEILDAVPGKYTKEYYALKFKNDTRKLYDVQDWQGILILHEKSIVDSFFGIEIKESTTISCYDGEITIIKKIKGFQEVKVIFSKDGKKRVIIFVKDSNAHAFYKNGVVTKLHFEEITGEALKYWNKWTDPKFGF